MTFITQSKKLTVLLLLCSFSLIRNLQVCILSTTTLCFAATAADESFSTKDVSNFDNRNLHGSNRRLVQSKAEPEIIITEGLYNKEFVGARNLLIGYSASNTTWTAIECTFEGQPPPYSPSFSWPPQWIVIQTWNPCPPLVNITHLGDRESYRFTIQGVPASESGNVTATTQWTVDHFPPQTRLREQCAQRCTKNDKRFTFFGTDRNGVESYQCQLNNKPWFNCTSPYTARVEQRNKTVHTFQVAAVDMAGNVDPSPASISWYSNNGSYVPRVRSSGGNWTTTSDDEESELPLVLGILLFVVLPCISCLSPCVIGYCCYRRSR